MTSNKHVFGVVGLAAVIGLAFTGSAKAAECENPDALTFAIVPTEESVAELTLYKPVTDRMARLTGKKIQFFMPTSYASVVEGMLSKFVDVAVLGCTHYPLVRHMLQRELGPDVQTIAAAEELAEEISETLARKGWQRDDDHRGAYRFLATGDVEAFREEGTRFLQLPIGDVEHVAVG